MKHYFYADKDQQLGPFTLDELKVKRLKKTTLVWTEGMQNWISACDIEELKDILIPEPPPLPKKTITPKQVTSTKYDLTYKKELDATIFGIIILVAVFVFNLINKDISPDFRVNYIYILIISFFIRIVTIFIVVEVAKHQNRNTTNWGLFAFFLPSLSLIIIGLLKKLKLKIEVDNSLPANKQVEFLFKKANKFFLKDRYSECIEILNKAIDIENKNIECIKLRGLSNYRIKKFEKAILDFEMLNKYDNDTSNNYYNELIKKCMEAITKNTITREKSN